MAQQVETEHLSGEALQTMLQEVGGTPAELADAIDGVIARAASGEEPALQEGEVAALRNTAAKLRVTPEAAVSG
jgi:hypothetical protein